MTLLNNLSILPFYQITANNPAPRNDQKWWIYGRNYPLFVPIGNNIPVQLSGGAPSSVTVCRLDGTVVLSMAVSFTQKTINGITYACSNSVFGNAVPGQYYLSCNYGGKNYISDVFTVVGDLTPYLKLEWWDNQDLIMDDGVILYTNSVGTNVYKNVLYLATDLAKPDYLFTEVGENRDGYFFAEKQISEKRYRFTIFAPEYLLDVMRFIRLSDNIRITYRGQVYNADTFLMTPTWEANGDVASVVCEFTTNTVAKKIGRLITP